MSADNETSRARLDWFAPRIRRYGFIRWTVRWGLSFLVCAAQVMLLSRMAVAGVSPGPLWLLLAVPAAIAAFIRPLRWWSYWYRWPLIVILWLTDWLGTPVLCFAEAWAIADVVAPIEAHDESQRNRTGRLATAVTTKLRKVFHRGNR